eukprot:Em0056g5a
MFIGSCFWLTHKLLIIWTPPVSRNGIITAYSVYCNPSESQENPVHLIGRNASTIKVVVNETTSAIVLDKYLNPDTQYECYVTATTSAGEGAPSERVTTRTSESASTAPRGSLSTVRYFPNLIIATWTPPNTTNGIITAYSVYCNTSVNGLIIGAKTNATTLVVTINTGSDMFTQCSCYVTANTSIGEGTPSQMITIQSLPSAPLNFSLAPISGSPDMLLAMWTAPAKQNSLSLHTLCTVIHLLPKHILNH